MLSDLALSLSVLGFMMCNMAIMTLSKLCRQFNSFEVKHVETWEWAGEDRNYDFLYGISPCVCLVQSTVSDHARL